MSTNKDFFDLVGEIAQRPRDNLLRAYAVKQTKAVLQNLDNQPFRPWFLEKEGTVVVEANLDYADLPADFLDFLEDSRVTFLRPDNTRSQLHRGFFENIQDDFLGKDPGEPEAYDLVGNRIYVGPTANLNYTLRFWYYQKSIPPADNTQELSDPWIINAEDMVAHYVASRVVRHRLRDMPFADSLQQEALGLRGELYRANESRKHTDMDYKIEGP